MACWPGFVLGPGRTKQGLLLLRDNFQGNEFSIIPPPECQNMWGPLNHGLYSYSFSRLPTVHFLLSEVAEELSRTQVIFSVYEFINSACVPSTPVWEFYLSTYTLLTVLYSVLSGLCFFHEVAT